MEPKVHIYVFAGPARYPYVYAENAEEGSIYWPDFLVLERRITTTGEELRLQRINPRRLHEILGPLIREKKDAGAEIINGPPSPLILPERYTDFTGEEKPTTDDIKNQSYRRLAVGLEY